MKGMNFAGRILTVNPLEIEGTLQKLFYLIWQCSTVTVDTPHAHDKIITI